MEPQVCQREQLTSGRHWPDAIPKRAATTKLHGNKNGGPAIDGYTEKDDSLQRATVRPQKRRAVAQPFMIWTYVWRRNNRKPSEKLGSRR